MSKLLDPKVLMAIKNLSLSAKMTVDGFMRGINKSRVKGPGLEFSQYRSYQPGDDLRSLDWRMYARSDRYYIREAEVQTHISIRFLIDASASMNHKDGDFTKLDYARYLAASLAYLCNLQGDAIGLYVFKKNGIYSLAPKQDFQHLSRLYFQLEQIEAAGTFTKQIHFKDLYAGAQKRELLVFMTDMYQNQDELFNLLDTLNTKHEVLVFHLMSPNELELNFEGYTKFEDLESGDVVAIDQDKARTVYKTNLALHLAETRMKLLERQIFYKMMPTNAPLDQALRDFLNQRNKQK